MIVPKKVTCVLGDRICDIDDEGWGRCGDGIVVGTTGNVFCVWIKQVLEWQDIEPVYLKDLGKKDDNHR